MIKIELAARFIPLVEKGQKTQTVRKGRRDYPIGPAVIFSGDVEIPIKIRRVVYCLFSDISEEEAILDGFLSKSELFDALSEFYPDISCDTEVTIVAFVLI